MIFTLYTQSSTIQDSRAILAVGKPSIRHILFPGITSPLIIFTIFYWLYATSVFNPDKA
jgi:hypothetical protein